MNKKGEVRMNKKWKFILSLISCIISIDVMYIFDLNKWSFGCGVVGVFLGNCFTETKDRFIDITDNTNWKTSQRRLERGGFINKNTRVRVSFSYLFRIRVQNKYFLVKNARGTGKYQPVGGVYKYENVEGKYLRQVFYAEDDNKIPSDESSKNDYRLNFENQYLRKFMKRFDQTYGRENLCNLSREFKEELIDTDLLDIKDFGTISYTYFGRHITDLEFDNYFQCYEILLADIVELNLTEIQEQKFLELLNKENDQYIFATMDDIKSLGVKAGSDELKAYIADHSAKILVGNNELFLPEGKQYKEAEYTCAVK